MVMFPLLLLSVHPEISKHLIVLMCNFCLLQVLVSACIAQVYDASHWSDQILHVSCNLSTSEAEWYSQT